MTGGDEELSKILGDDALISKIIEAGEGEREAEGGAEAEQESDELYKLDYEDTVSVSRMYRRTRPCPRICDPMLQCAHDAPDAPDFQRFQDLPRDLLSPRPGRSRAGQGSHTYFVASSTATLPRTPCRSRRSWTMMIRLSTSFCPSRGSLPREQHSNAQTLHRLRTTPAALYVPFLRAGAP